MNESAIEFNWIFRANNGWLYGYMYKPALSSNQNLFFPEVIARPVPGDRSILIKETDNGLAFIPKNHLIHINELMKTKTEDEA